MEETAVLRAAGGSTGAGTGSKVATGEGLVQFWYPTVTMNIDLKSRLPREGVEWLHTRVITRMLRGSRADLEVLILDQDGGLVATSTQVALVVDPARNGKGRGERKL
jgi:acyl-CoA thioesterase FadM